MLDCILPAVIRLYYGGYVMGRPYCLLYIVLHFALYVVGRLDYILRAVMRLYCIGYVMVRTYGTLYII